ncbi:C40 family peptidase [Sporosarcina sp. ACRSL]|uniref:C40 family peptidase n=1 Tax=Sporosarcina sp. ACRSL TaxID=2918215 RepID=UPI001EF71817|nr:C40 family peptidase [Sporosarcina sp. ACRSL]MCG7344304.1 C40 family peptidase [Sporosarcina sp. ACRSL]
MRILTRMQRQIAFFAIVLVLSFTPIFDQVEASSDTASISETAKSLQGIRYAYGGTTTAGFDCSGFVRYVFNQHGISLARTSSGMYASGTKVDKSDLIEGDLVFFNTSGKGVSHVGIYIGDGSFAHSSSTKGVSIAKIDDPHYWGKRYVGAKRITGTDDVAFNK